MAYASATTNTVHLWIARDLGLFEKYGLDANLVYISGSATALQALVGGDVDVVYGTGAAAVAGVVRGAPYPIEEAIQFAIEYIGGVSPEIAKAKALKASDFVDAGLLKEIEMEGFFARFRY